MTTLEALHRAVAGSDLTEPEARDVLLEILRGEVPLGRIAGLLVALRMKGETAAELTGFAKAMREMAHPVDPGGGAPLVDTCGTGGDLAGTFNISTVAAFVAAGAGVRVAKHGNRSVSSKGGSADLMEDLGVSLSLNPGQIGEAIRTAGIGFLFAPAIHPAVRHVQPARAELKMRTIFNYLGPLTNPSGAVAQVAGVPSEAAARLLAAALFQLGLRRGFVVHGSDGLDEITTTGPTFVCELTASGVVERTLTPTDFGIPVARPDDLRTGSREENVSIARAILSGERGPKRDIVLVNAAAALVAGGVVFNFTEAVQRAARSIDSGAAAARLTALIEYGRSAR